MLIHATCVSVQARGLLLTGPSGSGKSQLAHRLIARGSFLVADDQTLLTVEQGRLIASCPETIRGRLEIRGVGIVPAPTQSAAPVALVLELDAIRANEPGNRMPQRKPWTPAALNKSGTNHAAPLSDFVVVNCVLFDPYRPDAAEAALAALELLGN